MDKSSTSLQLAAQQVLHQLTVQRLVQRVYEQRLISNVERGAYIECMIELALRERHPAWSLTEMWDRWDLENQKTRARIEIKQSAALQAGAGGAQCAARPQSHDPEAPPSVAES